MYLIFFSIKQLGCQVQIQIWILLKRVPDPLILRNSVSNTRIRTRLGTLLPQYEYHRFCLSVGSCILFPSQRELIFLCLGATFLVGVLEHDNFMPLLLRDGVQGSIHPCNFSISLTPSYINLKRYELAEHSPNPRTLYEHYCVCQVLLEL